MKTFLEWLEIKEDAAVAEPPAAPAPNQQQAHQPQTPQNAPAGQKVIIYPDMQGVDNADNVNKGQQANLKVEDCIGNEPGKDFNYFKTGSSDKGKMIDYVSNMVKSAKEKGTASFPPIKAIKHPLLPGKYLVIDGNHRLGAFKIGGMPDIKATVIGEGDILLAVPGTKWQEGATPQTVTMDQARKSGVDLKTYFNTRELAVPQNDQWVVSLRMPQQNAQPARPQAQNGAPQQRPQQPQANAPQAQPQQ